MYSDSTSVPCYEEKKYLVFESCLLSLFAMCTNCGCYKTSSNLITTGSLVQVQVHCSHCDARYTWNSQPHINGVPAGNVLMSASILFSGALPTKSLRLFQILKCASISLKTFFSHQKRLLIPAIDVFWKAQQESMLTALQVEDKALVLGGDGRCDSPGFSAKYGSYSFMELDYNVVLHIELIQVIPLK